MEYKCTVLTNNRPMACAALSKKQQGKTSQIKSQTRDSPPPTLAKEETAPSSHHLRERLHSLSEKWDRVRPYVERINGTIVPLTPQGVDGRKKV